MSEPIYLARHGQTDWNAEFRLQGQSETDLNATGRQQAAVNGRQLAALLGADAARFAYVASPMKRTRETMEIIRSALGLVPGDYSVDPRLKELSYGDWETYTFAELEKVTPGLSTKRDGDKWGFLPPGEGAESYAMLAARVKPWAQDARGPSVVVTHGGVIRVLFNLLNGLSPQDAAAMDIPQDRIARIADGRIAWLDL
ncbi:MAG: histidine phosphatase family protein [Mesorhizobium sp.]